MPEVAANTTEAVLGGWSVGEGEQFRSGSVLVTVETAKAVVDVEAEHDGVFVRALVNEGSEVAVGSAIALLAAPDERVTDVDAVIASLIDAAPGARTQSTTAPSTPTPAAVAGTVAAPAAATVDTPPPPPNGLSRTFASPLARRLARDAGLGLDDIRPTGPNGRVVRRDVEAALAADHAASHPVTPARQSSSGYYDEPHSRMRRAIAAGLTASMQTVPHFYLRATVQADAVLRLREDLNHGAAERISLTDLIVKAVSVAHTRVPAMNVIWMPDTTRRFTTVDLAVAVATDGGLATPVLRGVEALGIDDLSAALKDLTTRARNGTLRQHELEGGTSTITNLGMFGTEDFAAIINPPQSSILAVGGVRSEAVVHEGQVIAASVLRLTVSVDHRPVDGITAAAWLRELVDCVERPAQILR
jgi:pyruvate dehydrogenase E2 component (dihydrolipoamide acetyltransferase)